LLAAVPSLTLQENFELQYRRPRDSGIAHGGSQPPRFHPANFRSDFRGPGARLCNEINVRAKSIGIVGGGIGGIATAVALHQAGFNAVVYEKEERLREVGVGMMLWPNATRVLRELGLLERVLACSGPNTHFLVRSSSGKVLMNIALGQFDVPAVCARRADLLAVLLTALPRERICLGHDLQYLKQSRNKVRLHFSGGLVSEHDAVVGADGIRSRVRSELFGDSDPIYRGYTVWRGAARYDGNALPPNSNSETWGIGKRFGILNTGHKRFTWYATSNVPSNHLDAPCGRKRELQDMFAGWHEPIADLIDASQEDEILKHGARDFAPLRRWGDGLVTLLGDAAHPCTPNLGQGGCMALEDALVLAKCLDREASLRDALRSYESLRFHRTRGIQHRSLLMGRIGQWQNPLLVTGRRVVTRLLSPKLIERNLRRVYAYQT
jgi:2-polyprenyl-6-methoxyphenol hydroxylase-like FAD-dependent oxidoreductase